MFVTLAASTYSGPVEVVGSCGLWAAAHMVLSKLISPRMNLVHCMPDSGASLTRKHGALQARTAAEQARRGQYMEQEWQRLATVVENGIVHGRPSTLTQDI